MASAALRGVHDVEAWPRWGPGSSGRSVGSVGATVSCSLSLQAQRPRERAPRRRAREELREIFARVIRGRRATGRREEDVLQQFIDAKWVTLVFPHS